MAGFPSGVVVVTALGDGGAPFGLTVSAFCPVSLEPPLILVCVDRTSNTLPALRRSGAFTVNILAAGHQELARRMATKSPQKFSGLTWRPAPVEGCGPVLEEHISAFACCAVERELEAGDHLIFLGRVLTGGVRDGRTPLLYHRRAFVDLG
jgi:flavin reductase (DIM6/NTAB) family NADH-FMN oxidoreductase RutF